MSALVVSLIAFACIFGGVLLGMVLRAVLPERHLSAESKDLVKLGTGTVATLAALVLGLLVASAKGTFDTMTAELNQLSAKVILLDHAMGQYGPETREARDLLRRNLSRAIQLVWPEEGGAVELAGVDQVGNEFDAVQDRIAHLSPHDDAKRWFQSQALQMSADIREARVRLIQQVGKSSIPKPFFVVLVFWLTIIFCSFGLHAPRNATVFIVLFVCALSAVCALFLIQELDAPYRGFIKISSAPLRSALAQLGR